MEQLAAFLESRLESCSYKTLEESLIGLLPKKLIPILCTEIRYTMELAQKIKNYPIIIRETGPFSQAQVCSGGVSTEEIRPETMESTLVPGLYFAGEVVDVDGNCGGYNLQWALEQRGGGRQGLRKGDHMIRITQMKLPVDHGSDALMKKITHILRVSRDEIERVQIVRQSLDARKKPELYLVYSVDVSLKGIREEKIWKKVNNKNVTLTDEKGYDFAPEGKVNPAFRPVVVEAVRRGCSARGFWHATDLRRRFWNGAIRWRNGSGR